jgi:hypothetical protein
MSSILRKESGRTLWRRFHPMDIFMAVSGLVSLALFAYAATLGPA